MIVFLFLKIASPDARFAEWIKKCHQIHDRQIECSGYIHSEERPDPIAKNQKIMVNTGLSEYEAHNKGSKEINLTLCHSLTDLESFQAAEVS